MVVSFQLEMNRAMVCACMYVCMAVAEVVERSVRVRCRGGEGDISTLK